MDRERDIDYYGPGLIMGIIMGTVLLVVLVLMGNDYRCAPTQGQNDGRNAQQNVGRNAPENALECHGACRSQADPDGPGTFQD